MQSEQVAVQPGVLPHDKNDKCLPDHAGCLRQAGSGSVARPSILQQPDGSMVYHG